MVPVFTLHFRCDNAVLLSDADRASEIARVLRDIADKIELDQEPPRHFLTIFDSHGRDVGRYALKDMPPW